MRFTIFLAAVLTALSPSVGAQQPATPPATMTVDQIVARVVEAERALIVRMRTLKPIVEVYLQTLEPHPRLGTVPVKDEYVLGQFDWNYAQGVPSLRRLTPDGGGRPQMVQWLTRSSNPQRADGFASMTVPDWRVLNDQRYDYRFLRREFLGEVRCLVFELRPKGNPLDGFSGRIWVDDRDFAIVRFNGITRRVSGTPLSGKKYWFNVDSWRVNVAPGQWLPAYVYSEQAGDDPREEPKLKSQMRLWGYELKSERPAQELTTIEIDAPLVNDTAPPPHLSPTVSQRLWEQQAEENVIERMTNAGLLAPPGDLDTVLETVVRNLQITNQLPVDPPIRARVMVTSPLESVTIGRTIVLSRGLIDVLPDESSLAMMLAHELAHITLGHKVIDTKFAFADKLMVPDDELLATVRHVRDAREEAEADAKVVEYLKNSPYADRLGEAGLFMRVIAENARRLRHLIQPHIGGDRGTGPAAPVRLGELVQQAPSLAPEKLDQIAALPLGARVSLDPWSSRVELLRTPTVPLTSAREKSSLAVTPLVPYLRYVDAAPAATAPGQRQ